MNPEDQHLEDIEAEINQDFFSRLCAGITYCIVCTCCALCGKETTE